MTTTTSVKDPVCGMDIDAARAAGKSEHDGQTYFFCSASCKQKFDAAPATYAGTTGGPTKERNSCCS